jgi:hypothetical protein
MKASKLIKELEKIIKQHGDIEVTCTHAALEEDGDKVYETTVENLIVHTRGEGIRAAFWPKLSEREKVEKVVRLWL